MFSIQTHSAASRVFFAMTFLAVTNSLCMGEQPPAAVEEVAPQKSLSAFPQQPADDEAPELKDPVKSVDPKKVESRAAFMEGLAAQKDGNLTDALEAFTRAAAADPTAAEPVRAHAILLRRLGRNQQAEEMARKAVKLDPDDYEMRLELAGMLLAQRNPGGVADASSLIDDALKSKRLNRKSAEFINLHSVRGRISLAKQKPDTAKAAESFSVILEALKTPEDFGLDFRQHQALMTDRATGYKTIGAIMLEVGRYDEAITAFDALVTLDENAPSDNHYWLALVHYRKDELDKAEENLNRYFDSNRRTRPSLQLLNDIYTAKSQTDQLAEKLGGLAKDSNDADAVNLFLGDILVEKGSSDEAARVFRDVIANSGNAAGYIGLIRVDILNRNAESLLGSVNKALKARIERSELAPLIDHIVRSEEFATELVNKAVESTEDDSTKQRPSAIYFYSQVAAQLKLIEQEGKLLKATLDQNPEPRLTVAAINRLGMNQYSRKDYSGAAETFRKMLSIRGLPADETANILLRLAAAESQNGNFEVAIRALQTALKQFPGSPLLQYQLGVAQIQAKKYSEAEQTLKTAIKVAESDPEFEAESRRLLGGLYSQLNRWEDAIKAYSGLLEMPELSAEDTRSARMALSNAYVRKGDMLNGEKILQEIYKGEPNSPGVNNDLGYLYAEQNKRLEEAEKMIRIAVEAEPENPAYLDSLGWVLYRRGKYDEASKVLEKANADPEYRDSTIIEHLGDVQKELNKLEEAAASWKEALDVENESTNPDAELIERLTEKLKVKDTPKAE